MCNGQYWKWQGQRNVHLTQSFPSLGLKLEAQPCPVCHCVYTHLSAFTASYHLLIISACHICVCACMCACDFVCSWQHSAGTNKQGQSLQSDSLRLVPFSLCPFLLILSSPSPPEIYCRLFQTPRPNDRGPLERRDWTGCRAPQTRYLLGPGHTGEGRV